MSIYLKKINQSSWMTLFKDYYVWFAFTAVLFILTHAFSALDLSRLYQFGLIDGVFTFGFLLFIGMLEVSGFAFVFVCLHLGIKKIFHVDPSAIFRLLLLAWFGLSWLNLLLTLFNRSLF